MQASINQFLKDQFELRLQRNKRYSLRAYARDLGIGHGKLSEILRGKRTVGRRLAQRIGVSLKFNEEELKLFVAAAASRVPKAKAMDRFSRIFSKRISEAELSSIVDWENYAILSLVETHDFRKDPRWVSHRLNISESRADHCLQQLEMLGLIVKTRGGRYRVNQRGTASTTDVPSVALRESHRQVLDLAKSSLDVVPLAQRDFQTLTLAMSEEKIPQAKVLIRDFLVKFCAKMETGRKNDVFTLNLQFFPNTQLESR